MPSVCIGCGRSDVDLLRHLGEKLLTGKCSGEREIDLVDPELRAALVRFRYQLKPDKSPSVLELDRLRPRGWR